MSAAKTDPVIIKK